MTNVKDSLVPLEESDAIDSYFECITACSISGEGIECITQCVATHLKEEKKG